MPEALWFSFVPPVDNANIWKLEKLGQLISPLEVVKDGNRNLHGVGKGVYYNGAEGSIPINPWIHRLYPRDQEGSYSLTILLRLWTGACISIYTITPGIPISVPGTKKMRNFALG